MADLTGEEVQRTRVLPAELADDLGQEPEVIVPRSGGDLLQESPARESPRNQGEAISWMFGESSRTTSVSLNPAVDEVVGRNRRQMGGSQITSEWMTAAEYAKMRLPGLDTTEEILGCRRSRFSLDESAEASSEESSNEVGYSRRDSKKEYREEVLTLLRLQLAEQRKLSVMVKAQTEILGGLSSHMRGLYALAYNDHRVNLMHKESFEQIIRTLDDVAYAVQWIVPDDVEKTPVKKEPTQAEMEAMAREMAMRVNERMSSSQDQVVGRDRGSGDTGKGTLPKDDAGKGTLPKDDGIPILPLGTTFPLSDKKKGPPPPPNVGPAEFRSKYV